MNRLPFHLYVSLFLVILLEGCASSSSMPEDHYYRLSPVAEVEKLSAPIIKSRLVVERIKTFGIYNERAILYASEDNPETLKYHHYHHWIDKPANLVREQLSNYLRDVALADNVVDDNSRQNRDMLLQVDIKKFERVLRTNGDVHVRITLRLKVSSERNDTQILFKSYTELNKAENGSMAATIRAFNLGLANIYQQLSNDIIESVGFIVNC